MICFLNFPLCRSCLWDMPMLGIAPDNLDLFPFHFLAGTHMHKSNVLHSYAPIHTSFKIASPKCPSAALHAIKWSMLILQCSCSWDKFLSHILPCTWHIKLQIQLSIYPANAYLQQLESLWAHKAGWRPLIQICIWVWSCDASCADVTAKGEVFLGGSRCWGFQAAHASPMTHVGHRTTEQLLPSLENHGFRHCWLNALVLGSLLLKRNVDRKPGMLALIMHIIERSFQICKHVLPFLVGSLRHLQWSCFNCLGGWCKSMFWLACR
jgi:hypothetical protein